MLAATLLCLIIDVTDGETLTARCGKPGAYKQIKVKIAAISAPTVQQPLGVISRQDLSKYCVQRTARIKVIDKDPDGHTIADVKCAGVDMGESQVQQGMARVSPQYAKNYPRLYELQEEAKKNNRGLWGDPNPSPLPRNVIEPSTGSNTTPP